MCLLSLRMSRRINVCAIVLLFLLELTTSAMVLPRPPSSHPNHIRQDQDLSAHKALEGKSLHGVPARDVNIDRPEDYRFVEIELRNADEMDAANLQGLVHAMLNQQQTSEQSQIPSDPGYPNPEVIPHSILGVRDMGLSPNYRLDTFDDDKRVLLRASPKLQSLDEKLYYLKSGRPRVYVNVRGHSGSFRKETTLTATPSEGAVGYLRVTRPFERQTDWKTRDRKARPPKKFDRRVDGVVSSKSQEVGSKANDQGTLYERADDPSTTENSMVTSSELPKQIPAPPSKIRTLMAQTTPVQRYAFRRTDILPGYGFIEE
ncbi:hypothetical protein ACS0PU_006471 [Formica fusca]|uniref:uncharacterized protein LOC115243821 isoform X1 n=1 Tax=Formica exsecta TaxID=72781 RepID=UPI001142AF4E|nr:uncharacterized protein LOC115243821 isoform X1 [Formica exsecta]